MKHPQRHVARRRIRKARRYDAVRRLLRHDGYARHAVKVARSTTTISSEIVAVGSIDDLPAWL